uniref:JmjC domain-containing protein n=1 Tax=Phaeomonas parva TaxID=124430 RepID=A0A7S1XW22_9STRA
MPTNDDKSKFGVDDVAAALGPDTEVTALGVREESELSLPLRDWAAYYRGEAVTVTHRNRATRRIVRPRRGRKRRKQTKAEEEKEEDGDGDGDGDGDAEVEADAADATEVLLNLVSLEYSCTPLSRRVAAPALVRELDWIDHAWPTILKRQGHEAALGLEGAEGGGDALGQAKPDLSRSEEGEDGIMAAAATPEEEGEKENLNAAATRNATRNAAAADNAKGRFSTHYPRVQNYCLMSPQHSYTDFHVDFGGTAVWYHVLRGRKTFFMAPPTDANLRALGAWSNALGLEGGGGFLPHSLPPRSVVKFDVREGETLLLPSGWLHAVYTPVDSLVFGGNFFFDAAADVQLRVGDWEEAFDVPRRLRCPFFPHIHWYARALNLSLRACTPCWRRT